MMSIPADRLYFFIKQLAKKNYGDNVIIYRFWPYGSKNIQNLEPLESYNWLERSTEPSIYCTDQEPLNYEYYRQNPRQFTGFLTKMYAKYGQIKTTNLNYFKSIFQKNILLHSEQASADLECYVRDNQLIPVYYWSHAVLALDWFRYAQHCAFRKQADKIFLIYNRAWTGTREYRIKFAELLIEHQLIDVSRTWFNPVDLESDLHYHDHVFKNPVFKHHQQIENFLSVTQASSINSADFDQKDYESTKIEVVLETLFDDQRIHLTEKVLRPLACGQPFILAATTGSLEYLKSYGFKTFDSLWDESYDQIADGSQRLGAIVNVMKHIKNLSPQQQTDLFRQAQHIARYNQQHFFGKEFFRQVIDELDQGLQQAFAEIKQLPPNYNYLNSWKTLLQVNEMIEYLQANADNQSEPSWNNVQQALVTADKMSKKKRYTEDMKLLLYMIFFVFCTSVTAQTYVQVNGVSAHDRPGYNGINYGAGVEHSLSKNWTVAAGWYYNSERRGSGYTYGRYAVYKKNAWDIGIAVGAVTGYQRAAVIPMAFPEMCYAWTCAMFAPRVEATGANVVGLRLRIPIN